MAPSEGSLLDRTLRIFGDVQPGEGRNTALLFLNVFILLVAYYIIKTVREPLILLTGGAELKTYAAAAQAALLVLYVPAYGWLAGRLPRARLLITVVIFFVACLQMFVLGGVAGLPVGFIYYVWVGIFSLTMIAQFWSFANDICSKAEGERLFPLVAVGSTAGAPIGAAIAERLFHIGISPWVMMELAAVLLGVHLLLYFAIRSPRASDGASAPAAAGRRNGFALVLQSPYLRMVGLLLILLNIINTTGEYILSNLVTIEAARLAAATPGFNSGAFIGEFYGSYFFWASIVSVTLQALVASRVVKYLGLPGALLALPVVALGAYGVAALGAGLMAVRAIKIAENSTDYSLMNTAKQLLWLPTTREEKYKGKQAIDTFFVRSGDMLAAGVVFVGTHLMTLTTAGFAMVNLAFAVGAISVGLLTLREYRRLTESRQAAA
jgi:AAA family ATP:ADP antiporter